MRIYSLDVLDEIVELLEDNLGDMIDTINTSRTLTTPKPLNITSSFAKNQFPEVFVDIESSTISQEEICKDPDSSREIYNLEITAYLKSAESDLYKWIEVYSEAMYKIIQNYYSDTITMIDVNETVRDTVQTAEKQMLKYITLRCSVQIN
jgi:hypothetical protein